MNTANKLTLARIVLIPFFLLFALPPVALLKGGLTEFFAQWGKTVALIIFILASVTDLLDGHIARRQNTITNTGKFLDPLADKLLISAAMIALVATRELSGWICFLILTREFAVTGIRTIAASAGYVIAANNWGKLKTVIQMIAVCMSYFPWDFIQSLSGIAWVAALIITVISGATYVKEFIKHEA